MPYIYKISIKYLCIVLISILILLSVPTLVKLIFKKQLILNKCVLLNLFRLNFVFLCLIGA